jgi:hypothetical protein
VGERPQQRKPPKRKKTWQRPRIKSGQLFESNSLSCGKTPAELGMKEECLQMGTSS